MRVSHVNHHFADEIRNIVFQMVYSLIHGWLTDGIQIGESFDKTPWQLIAQETERENLGSVLERVCKRFSSRYRMNNNQFNKVDTSLCYIRQSSYCR